MNNRIRSVVATGIIIMGGHFVYGLLSGLDTPFPRLITAILVIGVAIVVDKYVLPKLSDSDAEK